MAEFTEHYEDIEQRNNICDNYQSQGLRIIHDTFDPDWKRGDEPHGTLIFTDEPPTTIESEPPRSTHISTIDAIDTGKAKPARIKRVWEGRDYFYDCFVTESVKDQFVTGDVTVGDYVIVFFDERGEQIVTSKIFKSW